VCVLSIFVLFFFSSRRRHTRSYGDWSSDVCSSDLIREALEKAIKDGHTRYTHSLGILPLREAIAEHYLTTYGVTVSPDQILVTRSEERRVGKESRTRRSAYH